MGIWRSAAGSVCVEVTSADNSALLQVLASNDIVLYDISEINDLTLTADIDRASCTQAEKIVRKFGGKLRIIRLQGAFWRLKAILLRPIFLLGLLFVVLCAIVLPSRIFFVNVEGNTSIPDKLILEKADACGISFGASRKTVRSERVKNALLYAIPELQWAGVNTYGCVATIQVREKEESDVPMETGKQVGNIVASRDGIIVSATILNGDAQCVTGQAVKAGDILVSGYTDCGISIRVTCADAEILAQTNRFQQLITPTCGLKREDQIDTAVRYSLRVGKKLIKFYKDSGISDATCVKMYLEDYLTLPGDFRLPVALITERLYFYNTTVCAQQNMDWLREASKDYLLSQMVAGQILNTSDTIDVYENASILSGTYACLEMIGQVKYEETIFDYGEEH